jgi:hypothetical protein
MDKYYYLVSQLPMLFFDKEPAISYENFMAEAEKWLSPKDFALVSTLDMAEMAAKRADPAVLKTYKEAEQEIRSDLVAWRREKKSGREHKPAAFAALLSKKAILCRSKKICSSCGGTCCQRWRAVITLISNQSCCTVSNYRFCRDWLN